MCGGEDSSCYSWIVWRCDIDARTPFFLPYPSLPLNSPLPLPLFASPSPPSPFPLYMPRMGIGHWTGCRTAIDFDSSNTPAVHAHRGRAVAIHRVVRLLGQGTSQDACCVLTICLYARLLGQGTSQDACCVLTIASSEYADCGFVCACARHRRWWCACVVLYASCA